MHLTCSLRLSTTAIAGFAINAAVLAQQPESQPQSVVVDTPITAPPPHSNIDASDTLATDEFDDVDESQDAAAASNPLSSTSKLDTRLDYFDLDGSKDRFDINLKGDVMLHPRLKLAYEVHYWNTNITGTTEDGWERLVLRPIFFVDDVELSERWVSWARCLVPRGACMARASSASVATGCTTGASESASASPSSQV